MKISCLILNLALVLPSPLGGRRAMSPERLRHTNPDGIFCIAIVLGMVVVVVGNVWQALKRLDNIRRPSLYRHPFNWMSDPLQASLVGTVMAAGLTAGAAIRVGGSGEVGLWTVGMFASTAAGLAVGQAIAYRVFADGITA